MVATSVRLPKNIILLIDREVELGLIGSDRSEVIKTVLGQHFVARMDTLFGQSEKINIEQECAGPAKRSAT